MLRSVYNLRPNVSDLFSPFHCLLHPFLGRVSGRDSFLSGCWDPPLPIEEPRLPLLRVIPESSPLLLCPCSPTEPWTTPRDSSYLRSPPRTPPLIPMSIRSMVVRRTNQWRGTIQVILFVCLLRAILHLFFSSHGWASPAPFLIFSLDDEG